MASIFLSHSSKNNGWARKLQAWLEAKHHRSLFLDFDREAGLKAGDLWERQLYAKLRQCQVVLALVSRDWLDSRWCFAEAVQAREKGKRLVLARIDDVDTSTLFRDAQHLDFTSDEADALARLEAALVDVFDLQPDREPYPGLVPFDQRDAGVFVGRDPEIATLLEALESMRLKSRSGGERLLLLLGASGSGKSSLARAGALPRLHRLPERWQLLPPMRPGQDPVRELALCLAVMLRRNPEAVAGRLAAAGQDSGGPLQALADEVRLEAGQPEAAVLLVLDQMEELLHLSEAQACGRFLDVLRRALEHGDGRFLVLVTLRSEYLGEVQLLPFLTTPTPLSYREQTLDPVPLDRLEAIIREPGRRWPQPVEFADRLVERMVRDTGTRDALPLLAFTLNRLWRNTPARADGVFQLEEYERLGGLEGSVQTAADEALDLRRRAPAELEVLRETFVPGLVRVDAAGVRTRRRAFLADLAPAARGLLKRFVDQGLLVTNRDPEGRETVEVAHEALLRTWPQLDTWLAEDQDALRLLDGLERTARDWEAGKRSPELLAHRGARLAEVQALLGQPRFRQVIGETERHYLEASDQAEAERAAREREEQERRIRDAERIAEEQRKVARRTKMGALIALVLMAAAIGAAVAALQQRNESQARLEQTVDTTAGFVRDAVQISDSYGVPRSAIEVLLTRADNTFEQIMRDATTPHLRSARAWQLMATADNYGVTGQTAQQLDTAKRARDILEELVADDPNPEWRQQLAFSHDLVGDALANQSQVDAALAAYRASQSIREKLSTDDSSNLNLKRALSISDIKIGDLDFKQGHLEEALAAFDSASKIINELARVDSNLEWQRDVMVINHKIGDVLVRQGNLTDAGKAYRASLDIAQKLAADNPSNAQLHQDLSASHEKIGNIREDQEEIKAALEAYQGSLLITQQLAADDPAKVDIQRDLSLGHENIGRILLKQGDLQVALDHYRRSLDIRNQLADRNPSKTELQRDVLNLHDRIGDILYKLGQVQEAIAAYQASLVIAKRLADLEPKNDEWRYISYRQLGRVRESGGNKEEAQDMYCRAKQVVITNSALHPAEPQWQKRLNWIEQRLAVVQGSDASGC